MEAINHIRETSKLYLSPYTIPIGNVVVTHDSLKISIRSLSKEYQLQCKIYSMAYKFNEPVTFTNCYNAQHGYYYSMPKYVYKLKKGYGVTGMVNNANILATINNYPLVDVYKMRFWFLLMAYTYGYTNKDITINDLLTKCCVEWKKLYDDGTLVNHMLNQSIKNVGRKTFTVGNVSATEKNRLSHDVKFSEEEREFVLFCKNVNELSYRKTKAEFESRYGKEISLKTMQDIVKGHKEEQCLEQTAPSGIHMPANLQDTIENEPNSTLDVVDEKQCLETTATGGIQSLDVVEATFDEEDEWSMLENDLSGMITRATI